MTPIHPLDPRQAIVIGAGPGLGAAIARRFGRAGFGVTLVARNPASLCRKLRNHGIAADSVSADAGEPYAFRRVLEDLASAHSPGVVVYNAAAVAADNILTDDTDHLMSTYAINVLGAITAAQVFTPAMRRAGEGTFLATSGRPGPAQASLSLGKAGLRAAVALMHDELKTGGVHAACVTVVGAIVPGAEDVIAETYWELHKQRAAEWEAEALVTAGTGGTPL